MARFSNQQPSEYDEKVVQVNRVSKKTKGGNQIGFTVLMVVGDKKGKVGVALGKASDVLSSIKKGIRKAKKRKITVPVKKNTIPFQVESKYGAARVLLKPAPPGSGIIAGGAVRAVVEAAGITDIVGKILGSSNQANNVYATFKALSEIKRLVKVKNIKLEPQKAEVKKEPVKETKAAPKKPAAKPAGKPVAKAPAKKAAPKKPAAKKAPTSAKKK